VFTSGETKNIAFTTASNVRSITAMDVPRGWTVQISPLSGNAGTFTVTAPAAAGRSYAAAGRVTFLVSDGGERSITETLALECPPYAAPEALGITFAQPAAFLPGETRSVGFTTQGGAVLVKALNVPTGWTVGITRSGDNGTFTITAPSVFTPADENGSEAIILVSDDAGQVVTRLFRLTGAFLRTDKDAIPAVGQSNAYSIAVTSNTAWTANVNAEAAAWCTLTNASATGNGAVTVNVTYNPDLPRSATVTVTAGTLNRQVVVTQEQPVVAATLCEQCCWSGAWVNCYVTTNAYPFNSSSDNTPVEWSGNGDTYYSDARSDRDGRANTAAIASTGTSAVQICKDLGTGWYLPAYEELVNMGDGSYSHFLPLNGRPANLLSTPNDYHWSSTEDYDNGGRRTTTSTTAVQAAAVMVSYIGDLDYDHKTSTRYVRCAWRN
jgi:hypothetical protein